MSNFNEKNRKYAYLEQLSTEKLEEQLSSRFSEDEAVSEYFDAVEEVILKRETLSPTGRLSDLDASWEEFRRQYAAAEGKGVELYPTAEPVPEKEQSATASRPGRHQKRKLLKKLTLIAAVIAVLSATMVAAQAAGLDVWGMFARWTAETFQFLDSGGEVQSQHRDYYEQIQAEVEKCGIGEAVVPTWYPEGYALESVDYVNTDTRRAVSCFFVKDETSNFSILILNYSGTSQISSHIFEKDYQEIETYVSNGKSFYLITNFNLCSAVWANDSICISISGTLSTEELKIIIDSIGG